jgi:hypothetical protein
MTMADRWTEVVRLLGLEDTPEAKIAFAQGAKYIIDCLMGEVRYNRVPLTWMVDQFELRAVRERNAELAAVQRRLEQE